MTKTPSSSVRSGGRSLFGLVALCTFAAAGALPAFACGGAKKPAESATAGEPTENGTLDEKSAAAATPPPPDSASAAPAPEPPLGQVLTTDSGQIQKIFDAMNASPSATLKPDGAKGGDALAKGVRDAAKKLSAGMQPEGPLAMGSIKEKQHLHTEVTLQPGKCYSIVGFSAKVKDLDLYLLLPPGILSGQDLSDDNKPIIGGPPQPMCPVSPQPVTYKLDIFADNGNGDVAVQLFSKGK